MQFVSTEKNGAGEPLLRGLLVDFGALPLDEDDLEKRAPALLEALKLKRQGAFRPPFMIVDMAAPRDIHILVAGEPFQWPEGGALSPLARDNPALKLLVPADQVVDMRFITAAGFGRSVVKCNPAFPVWHWFQAANLILKHSDQKGRVVPFPMDQDGGGTIYHMLRCDLREHLQYERILSHACATEGIEAGFRTAAKFSYEILAVRGVKELTRDQVDDTLSHVLLMEHPHMDGVLLHRAGRDELEGLAESFSIFY